MQNDTIRMISMIPKKILKPKPAFGLFGKQIIMICDAIRAALKPKYAFLSFGRKKYLTFVAEY